MRWFTKTTIIKSQQHKPKSNQKQCIILLVFKRFKLNWDIFFEGNVNQSNRNNMWNFVSWNFRTIKLDSFFYNSWDRVDYFICLCIKSTIHLLTKITCQIFWDTFVFFFIFSHFLHENEDDNLMDIIDFCVFFSYKIKNKEKKIRSTYFLNGQNKFVRQAQQQTMDKSNHSEQLLKIKFKYLSTKCTINVNKLMNIWRKKTEYKNDFKKKRLV